jgi:hypothetical protein
MAPPLRWSVLLLLVSIAVVAATDCGPRVEHTQTFLSPGITIRPGDVNNKYYPVSSPPGSFATVDFNAELVYEDGTPVPLTDVYLHHWIMFEITVPEGERALAGHEVHEVMAGHGAHAYLHGSGGLLREQRMIQQAWAKGGETRHLNSTIPAPYGMASGGEGLKTQWVLNVHGIDTRGAKDRMGCTECRCDLFTGGNRTDVPDDYLGGLYCCPDESRCALRDDVNRDDITLERTVHLKYTWTYIALDSCVIPLKSQGLDVTATTTSNGTVEYNVEGSCAPADFHKPECIDTRETVIEARYGGPLVYAVAHLHAYALDSSLWGEDGRLLCHSPPIYGHGSAAGDEKGYVVGIRHCNPSFGENGIVKKGEKLRFQVKYTRVHGPHTGVMGFLFTKFAEESEIVQTVAIRASGNRKILN